MPRLDFTRGFFQVGGFRILEDGFFTKAATAVGAFEKTDAPVVVLVGVDKTYDQLGAEVVKGLKSLSPPPTVVLAGGAPEQNEGVDFSINARSNILDVLGKLAESLGVQS